LIQYHVSKQLILDFFFKRQKLAGQIDMCFFFLSLGTHMTLDAPLSLAGSLAISILKKVIVLLVHVLGVDVLSPLFLFSSLINEQVVSTESLAAVSRVW
jgi:RsiW-degrading membrane proteinase PrsW (M82 family)